MIIYAALTLCVISFLLTSLLGMICSYNTEVNVSLLEELRCLVIEGVCLVEEKNKTGSLRYKKKLLSLGRSYLKFGRKATPHISCSKSQK